MGFFEDRPKSPNGRFFADMPGREKGDFHKQAMTPGQAPMGAGVAANASSGSNASPTQMATSDSPAAPNQAQSASAGALYGTGSGCGPGSKPTAGVTQGAKKVAALTPADADYVFPMGFHRPTTDQPEPLEAGAERFHSTDAPFADFGTGKGIRQGGTADGNFMGSLVGGQQMGKHAEPSVASGEFWKNRASDAGNSIRSGASDLGSMASQGVEGLTRSPVLMTLGAGLLARRGVKGAANAIKKVRVARAAKALGHAGEAAGAAKKTLSLGERVSEGAQKIQRFLRR